MKPHESLGFEVAIMARLFERELRAALRDLHVLPGQLPVLLALYDRDGRTQAELARIVGVEQPTMAATLARMEQAGLVGRSPDEDDARRARVGLTERSREIRRPLIDAARSVNRRAVRGLSADDRSVLYRVVESVSSNLAGR